MKKIFFLMVFLSTQSWGDQIFLEPKDSTQTYYTIETTQDSSIFGCFSEPCLNELVYEEPENSTATNVLTTVYVPMLDNAVDLLFIPPNATSTIGSNLHYSLFIEASGSTTTNSLPSYTNSENPSLIKHKFTIQNTLNVTQYIFAAVVDPQDQGADKDIFIISRDGDGQNLGQVSGNASGDYFVSLNLFNLCNSANLSTFYNSPCSNLKPDLDNTDRLSPTLQIYFFLSTCSSIRSQNSAECNLQVAKVSNYPGGIFFKYILSNMANAEPPIINSLAKGDERVTVNYSGDGINYLYDVIAINYPMASSTTEQTYFDALLGGGAISSIDNGANQTGKIIIKGLENNQPVKIGIAYVNKFKFATLITDSEEQVPMAITTFIQEKQCYLLSAGFGKDHFVLEYFRSVRDNFLVKNSLGRVFVKWYYRTAPEFAEIIYRNSSLRFIVRILGYLAYFSIRFFPVIFAILLIYLISMKYLFIRE